MKTQIALTIFLLLFSILSRGQYTYTQPEALNDGWKTGNLRLQNIDTSRIHQLFTQLQAGTNKIHSVLLVKNNEIIIEEYFNGHSENKQHDLRSVTKSIRSMLLGIAIDRKFIGSIDDPISNYLSNQVPTKNLDERKGKITIRHLLTMSTGLDCNDWDQKSAGQEDRVYRKKDWIQYTLNLPMINEPGDVSNYCSMGTVLLAEIISQASGMTIDKFAKEYLFEPLRISNVSWGHTSNKKIIPSAKRLYLTSRDMAKIGQLILNKGKWEEKEIVSEKWITESTAPATKITGIDYGFLWWNLPFRIDTMVIPIKAATGNGGQYIMVIPSLDVVAVFTGGAYNSQEDKLPFAIMKDVFLPALVDQND